MLPNSAHGMSEPTAPSRPIARRKRKPLSCSLCRRRKLACDREYPSCTRCRKTGNSESCSYEDPPAPLRQNQRRSDVSGQNRPVLTAATPVLRNTASSSSLEGYRGNDDNRPIASDLTEYADTWQLLGGDVDGATTGKERPAIKADVTELTYPPEPKPTEAVVFRGENYRTQYYGSTNPTSLIGHFPELRSYMKETIKHHASLPGVQKELKALDTKWKYEKPSNLPVKTADLLLLLPDQTEMDASIRLYFDTFETMYRIVHRPTFMEEYDQLQKDRTAAKPGFIVLVLLILATVSCTTETDRTYVGSSSIGREQGSLWIETAEAWLGKQSRKNIYLAIWQIRCLLVLAKQMCRYKKKRMWSVAGDLVREGMAAGFHRDPSRLGGKITFFDQEIRRRLWATMTELELQASVERGMPSALAAIRMDCAPPVDIDDEDLRPESDPTQIQGSSGDSPSTFFLRLCRNSLDLRVALNSRMNDLTSDLPYEDILRYEDIIMNELRKLPSPVENNENTNDSRLSQMARTVLDLQLRQFLVLLHAPFARKTEGNSRYAVSRMVCFNAAASMIDQHWRLVQSGNPMLLLLRHDYFRGALNLSHYAYLSSDIRADLCVPVDRDALLQYIQNALTMLEDSITYLGTGFTYHWYISAAISFLRSQTQPAKSSTLKQEAINQVVRQYYRVLASQEQFSRAKERIYSSQFRQRNPSEAERQFDVLDTAEMSLDDVGFSQFDPTVPTMEQYFFGDPAAWTFDNLWEVG
ncbi:fungal-specific transcription factor domain-containing protein [Aspergillus pseudotamarii]|uniref:Fungal-specific transcription factor domain-containing protein n=1 Tax=Aspergillus pseudotamarii TaxID=132259 RepID=A0A5N6T4U1_ASPPS|nr:fungal-specific transcription factor domain-containing protein [Aspergillus pseudotamarii]KAE8141325.1 fungal-specific transcription factor domain-containing protein [Aspergillus pseudotamarii]